MNGVDLAALLYELPGDAATTLIMVVNRNKFELPGPLPPWMRPNQTGPRQLSADAGCPIRDASESPSCNIHR